MSATGNEKPVKRGSKPLLVGSNGSRASQLSATNEHFDSFFRCFFDSLGASCFLLDSRRAVLETNGAARSLVESGQILFIDSQQVLSARCPRGDQHLDEAVTHVAASEEGSEARTRAASVVVSHPEAAGGVVVHVLGMAEVPNRIVLMVPQVVANGESGALGDLLRRLYGLTRAEARLASAMLRGVTHGADLARTLDRSEWTIRSQIRSLLAKLDVATKSQAVTKMSMEVLFVNPSVFDGSGPQGRSREPARK